MLVLHPCNQSLHEGQPQAFKELSWRCRQEYWHGSPGQQANYKIMSEEFLYIPCRPKEPHYPEALALNTSPTPRDDTTSSAGSCQAKVFFFFFFFFFFFHISPSVLKQHYGATFPNSVDLKAALAIWQPEETVSATIDIFPILLACHLPFSGHLIDSDSLYWVFHMKENFVIKC